MKLTNLLHWIALILLAYQGVASVYHQGGDALYLLAAVTAFWSFLWWQLYSRPKSWGLGIGLFLLIVIVIQLGLWRLALTKKEEYHVNDSWLYFIVSVIPLAGAAACSISLRWLFPAPPPAESRTAA